MLKKLKKNKKGFTLAELLIVVAIIGVLVAVSIPIFTSQLEKAREATDVANMRAAKAEAVSIYLSGGAQKDVIQGSTATADVSEGFTAYYDAVNGKLTNAAPSKPYGKGTSTDAKNTELGYTNGDYTNSVIKVTVATTGDVTLEWEALS